MTYRKTKIPQIEFRSYDSDLKLRGDKIDIHCSKDISRMLNEDGSFDRPGSVIEIDLLEDDIDEIKKKLHLLTYIRQEDENQ
jgi:hypothetical protein